MKEYKKYNQTKEFNEVTYQFFECLTLVDIPGNIQAALSFTMIGDALVLTKKKNGWWDIVGGKIEEGESIKETLYRENLEEAGVHINTKNMFLVGYIKAENMTSNKSVFSKTNYMPVFVTFVEYVDREWKHKKETVTRGVFSFKKATKLFEERGDNGQLQEVSDYTKLFIKNLGLKYEFPFYHVNEIKGLDLSPVSQVMVFCKDDNGKYCVVKDFDEDFYSLLGGGCELDEMPIEGIKREMFEEAQIVGSNFRLLGSVMVNIYYNDQKIASTQHLRYLCEIEKIEDFIPRKDGFEVEDRIFINKEDLYEKVMLLHNSTGIEILKNI